MSNYSHKLSSYYLYPFLISAHNTNHFIILSNLTIFKSSNQSQIYFLSQNLFISSFPILILTQITSVYPVFPSFLYIQISNVHFNCHFQISSLYAIPYNSLTIVRGPSALPVTRVPWLLYAVFVRLKDWSALKPVRSVGKCPLRFERDIV